MLLITQALRVVGSPESLRRGIAEKPLHSGVAELGAVPRPVASIVKKPRDRLFSPVLKEEFVHPPSNSGFLGIGNERAVFPSISEGRLATQGLSELGADRD